MGIKKVVQAWNSVSLVKRIVIGLVIGGVLGVAVPNIEASSCWARCSCRR